MLNVVNVAKWTPARWILIVRHRDRPGVLAQVLDAISAARINVQEMENTVFEGAEAAVARIYLEEAPAGDTLEKLRQSNPDFLEINLIRLGEINSGKPLSV